MKNILFGNPNTDSWMLALDGISRGEQVISVKGELRTGFFSAVTPMCIPPHVMQSFASELEALEEKLAGSATLQNANYQSAVNWTLKALPHGHIESTGQFTINGNTLSFAFRTDQTQLAPLCKWVRSLLSEYNKAKDG